MKDEMRSGACTVVDLVSRQRMSVSDRLCRLWRLSVPGTALVSYLTALIFTFVAFTVGGLASLLASPPMALVYLAVFGSAFVAAFSRSRYLPQIAFIEF